MKDVRLLLTLLLVPVIMLAACSKDRNAELRGDWLFPLAKGNLSINSISSLENLRYDVSIPAISLGIPEGISVSSAGLRISQVGPFALRISDWLRRIDIDTLQFTGSLENFFPVPIGSGTRITMRNGRDPSTSTIVGEMAIAADVPPGSAFNFDINVFQKSLVDSVYFFLEDFRSPPYSNVVFSSRPSQLSIRLGVVSASYIEIYTNKRFVSSDTFAFNAGSGEPAGQTPLDDTATRGLLNVFCENGLPAAVSGQIYFLDETRARVLDSLFSSDLMIAAGQTDASGNTTVTAATRQRVPVDDRRLDAIKAARFIATRFTVSSEGLTPPFVGANRSATLRMQFTGDLNITVRF